MFKLSLKIAIRNLTRSYFTSLINIGGLGIALAAFILIVTYVNYETSYDKSNPNYDNIYIVGRDLAGAKTNFTPPSLGQLIEQYCPEVELVGKMKATNFGFAMFSKQGKVYVEKSLVVDYNAAKMFNLHPQNGLKRPAGKEERLFYLKEPSMHTLFPGKKDNMPELVAMGSKISGLTGIVSGSITPDPHSNIQFDALVVANEIGEEEGFGYPNYYTYIQVKPGINILDLQLKIDQLLKGGMIKENKDQKAIDYKKPIIFLDPLSNLHLRPMAGNNTNYKVVMVLFFLSILIVIIACINYTNLTTAQASKRAKEVGVKKVLGAHRYMLMLQFLVEILVQCILSVIIALVLTEVCLPAFNNLFEVPLSLTGAGDLFWILPILLLIITIIAGIYPALVLSAFEPARVLKGNFQTSIESHWLRKTLLITQLTIAVVFIAGIAIVSTQVKYMHTEDTGFNTNQVILIKNIAYFNKPDVFAPVREKILKIEGVESVTVASNVPDGSAVGNNSYTIEGRETSLDFVDVDFDYFETLGIKLKNGRTFSRAYKSDTSNSAVINESAAAKFGLVDPIGKTIRGCDIDYKVVGIIRDFKSQGFENVVQPTIYAMKNQCGNARLNIMIRVNGGQMGNIIATLKREWFSINKLDGEDFRYEFLDDLYGRLFKKQEQLRSVLFISGMLTIFISVLGLFAYSRFMTNNRTKEIAIRKILGATNFQVLRLLNTSFLWMLIIANLIAWPFVYMLAKYWLATFAYRIDISVLPFVLTGLFTLVLTIITVTIQALKAVYANPVDALKYE
jgi:putative ABC transport system permease protein